MDRKPLPTVNGKTVAAGTENETFWAEIGAGTDTTSGWDKLVVPSGVEYKNCRISVRAETDTAALTEDPITFLFSSNSDGAGATIAYGGLIPGAAKKEGDTIGYLKQGTVGRKVAILVLS
ncbi:MAG: hypothetical protein JEZ12_21630 [Desulfobacterium sp.]|nr:hypothetical protein [Desulfobacterium sp.]